MEKAFFFMMGKIIPSIAVGMLRKNDVTKTQNRYNSSQLIRLAASTFELGFQNNQSNE